MRARDVRRRRPVRRRRAGRWLGSAAVALAVGSVLGLAGCASGGPRAGSGPDGSVSSGVATDTPGVMTGGVPCDQTGPYVPAPGTTPPNPVPLAATFVPVEATRCVLRTDAVQGDGEWLIRVEQRAGGDLSALATELRKPDQRPAADQVCTAIGYIPTIITLVDASGATTVPAVPKEACGGPIRSALSAIEALSWQTVRETPVHRTRSQLEVESGCPGAYKPVVGLIAVEGARPAGAGAGPVFRSIPAALKVCRYEIDHSERITTANGIGLGLGVLSSAGTLDGATLTRLIAAFDAAPAADGTCASQESPFAVLIPEGEGGPQVVVELAGCHRLLPDGGTLRQLDAATVAPLLA